ncbi:uncharacterized protein A4U43_C01F22120 [Asparagus officinalis]|uniref:Uncharacterized protein n=1 Tax=Asparagus officinalis TaxID=4686 RepID=A0A5P1FRH2_ASPOF|nr:uncharacterized protein A4U43_C01F22120 [Asparagus officinalis]
MEGMALNGWKDLPMELLLRIVSLIDGRTVIVASGWVGGGDDGRWRGNRRTDDRSNDDCRGYPVGSGGVTRGRAEAAADGRRMAMVCRRATAAAAVGTGRPAAGQLVAMAVSGVAAACRLVAAGGDEWRWWRWVRVASGAADGRAVAWW